MFKGKLLPRRDVIQELIEYWFDGGRNEHYSLSLRAKMIDPNIKLREVLTNVHRPRNLLLDMIYHTDRQNVYRVEDFLVNFARLDRGIKIIV